jgi:hypothetical protein
MLENISDRALLETADEYAGFRILYSGYWAALCKKASFCFGNSADAGEYLLFPRISALSEAAWINSNNRNYDNFFNSF